MRTRQQENEYHRKRNAKMRAAGYKQISQFIHKDDIKKVKAYIKLLEAQRLFEEAEQQKED